MLKRLSLRAWIGFWLFLYLVTLLSTPGHGKQAAIVLLFTGLYVAVMKRAQKDNFPFNTQELIFIGLIAIFSLIQILGAIFQPAGFEYVTLSEKLNAMDNASRWLLMIPIYLLFRRYLIDWRWMAIGISIGAFIAAGIAHYQVYFQGIARANGVSNHFLTFAELMVAVDLLLWMLMIYAWDKGYKFLSAFLLLASLAAFYGSLLSVTRGAWLAYVVMIAIWIIYTARKSFVNLKHLVSTPVLARLLFAALVFFAVSQTDQYNVIQDRMSQTIQALATDNINVATTGRDKIFKQAFVYIEENPFGVGTDNLGHIMGGHAHNEFLNVWTENGVQGLVALISLFLYSIIFFYRKLNKDNELIRLYAALGLMLIISYAIFGQTYVVLSRNETQMLFIMTLYFFYGQIQLLEAKRSRSPDSKIGIVSGNSDSRS